MSKQENIFMIGLNEFNHEKLKSLPNFEHYNFHGVIPPEEAEDADSYDVEDMLNKLRTTLKNFDGSVDAIVTYIDFPISMMTPLLCKEYNLPSASLESVLKCHHKYWSRVVQREVIPEHVPKFNKVNPFAKNPLDQIDIKFPFWLKPVKSVGSYLGFRVENKKQFNKFIEIIREHINRMSEPFNNILNRVDLPEDIQGVDGSYCLAEEIIGGRQCTLEGYVHNGEVKIFGVIDSIRHKNRTTFFRYEYPSRLPNAIQKQMGEISTKVLKHIGYDNSAFNIEFFWSQSKNKIWILEINTRVSQSHSDLFEKVDGVSNHKATIDTGLGRNPDFPFRKGKYKCASKFFFRKWDDGIVTRVPTREELDEIEKDLDGTHVELIVKEGIRLSDLNEQDSYSFMLAWIFIGGKDEKDLVRKYNECIKRMHFEFKPVKHELPVGVIEGENDQEQPSGLDEVMPLP